MHKGLNTILITTLSIGGLLTFNSCTKKPGGDGGSSSQPRMGETMKKAEGLDVEVIKSGTGAEATAGKRVSVHYTGWLKDGTKFDSSVDRGTPFQFMLGAGQVIQGWDKGVQGMHVGEKRKLTIAPELGYGANGAGNVIPPNSTLVFEVELLEVQ